MFLVGAVPLVRACLLTVAQILGGMAAAGLVSALFPGALNVQTSLGNGTSVVQGLFIEMFLTAELVFTIFMLAAEKHKGTFIAPVGIGLSLFVAEMSGMPHVQLFPRTLAEQSDRRILYWRFAQPGTIVRSECGAPPILPLPLDLLAWPHPRLVCGGRVLHVYQNARVRDGQSGTGLGREGSAGVRPRG